MIAPRSLIAIHCRRFECRSALTSSLEKRGMTVTGLTAGVITKPKLEKALKHKGVARSAVAAFRCRSEDTATMLHKRIGMLTVVKKGSINSTPDHS